MMTKQFFLVVALLVHLAASASLKDNKGCHGFLFVSCDKKHGYNRLSCALSDYDSDGDGTVRVPEFLSSVSAGSEGEGIAGLIDQNNDGVFSELEFSDSLPLLRSKDIVNC
ncbi:uncharacterized protein LOC111126459 [Crassostrea virginica]